jgi:hypothetical protein
VEREHLFSPLKDASEDIALSVSFFQSLEEPQLENAFEAEKNTCMSKQYPEDMMCGVERQTDSTIFTLLWVIRNLSASETITSSWSCIKLAKSITMSENSVSTVH